MRWIVGSLVAINILVLIWQLVTQEPEASPAPQARQSVNDAPPIKMLSELEEETLQAMMANRQRVKLNPETNVETTAPLCTLIGPFEKLLRAEYFVERLQALDVVGKVQEVEIPGEVGFWVYLPSLSTRKEAFDKLRELQSKGIDSYVIPRGDLENGISFGMFSQATLAKQRLADMRSQGYGAELQEVERSYKEIWVILQPGQSQQLDPESWQSVLAEETGLERRQNYCPAVASE
jgi:hypothetical protein